MQNSLTLLANVLSMVGAVFGVISGVYALFQIQGNGRLTQILMLALMGSLLSAAWIYRRIKRKITTVLGAKLDYPSYQVRRATREDLIAISRMQKSFYPDDAVPLDLYREWYDVNGNGFFVVVLSRLGGRPDLEDIIGHFTFLAIGEQRMKLYREGKIRETDIRGVDLVAPAESVVVENIYIESIIVKANHRRHAMPCLLGMLKTMTLSFCNGAVPQYVYAMAATGDGRKALHSLSCFELLEPSSGGKRVDEHTMHRAAFEKFVSAVEARGEQYEINQLNRRLRAS